MILTSICIKNLFGLYSYEIEIPKDRKLNIITGLNGTGKTTILKILDNLSKGNLYYIFELPFNEICLRFDERTLKITSSEIIKKDAGSGDEDKDDIPDKELLFTWYSNMDHHKIQGKLKLNKKALREALHPEWDHLYFHNYLKISELDSIYDNDKSIYNAIAKSQKQDSFMMLTSSISVKYIESQRLYIFENDSDNRLCSLKYKDEDDNKEHYRKPSIYDVVEKLKKHLSDALLEFLHVSQDKSNKLIDNLLSSTIRNYNEEEYNEIADELNIIIKELTSYRLINDSIRKYDSAKKDILSIYINDLRDKLNTYSKILKELNLFSTLINKKKFAHKKISFSPQYGLRVSSENGDIIDPIKLSSGEQNEVILLYKLIFEVPENTLLLIDEPEISLHVVWQTQFMEDLEEISRVRNIQIIIATHSPEIIGNRWNQCYDLSYNHNN